MDIKEKMKPKYKKLYSEIVKILASFSKDKRKQVGALLLKDNRIIATGYNGKPNNFPEKEYLINNHDISAVHAEMNCLCFAAKHGISIKDCEIFVSHFPCIQCTKLLYQSGIKKIYYVENYKNDENIYKDIIPTEKI